ncbi:MAG: hypothetical protein JSU70_00785 [Phycisphaerales bacterium]|nr:MAG: hypothetical protein JSU70_00785 [Phycisphaerales bacterium]
MKNATLTVAVVFLWLAMSGPVALALAPMGPPKGLLEKGRWAIDAEYSYGQMDLKACGDCAYSVYLAVVPDEGEPTEETVPGVVTQGIEIDNLKSNMFLASLAYGLCDNWDVYARVGAADAKGKVYNGRFSGGFGFVGGLGTRATFCESGKLTWGGLLQVTWTNPGRDNVTLTEPVSVGEDDYLIPITGPMRIHWHEVQAAVGPTLRMGDFSVYGGAFVHYVNGTIDWNGTGTITEEGPSYTKVVSPTLACEFDVGERSEFGGYAGAMWNVIDNASIYVEGQFTGMDYGIMAGGYLAVP